MPRINKLPDGFYWYKIGGLTGFDTIAKVEGNTIRLWSLDRMPLPDIEDHGEIISGRLTLENAPEPEIKDANK